MTGTPGRDDGDGTPRDGAEGSTPGVSPTAGPGEGHDAGEATERDEFGVEGTLPAKTRPPQAPDETSTEDDLKAPLTDPGPSS